jgi:membrane protease YdiL (CAAX protease family)
MAVFTQPQVLRALLASFLLTYFLGILAAWGWLIQRVWQRQPLFPREPLVARREVPWGLGTVLLVILIYVLTQISVVRGYAHVTGRNLATPSAPLAANANEKTADSKRTAVRAVESNAKETETFSQTEKVFLVAVIDSVLLVLLPLLARYTCGASLRDLGLSFRGWGKQAAIGIVAILITTPLVYLIQYPATQIWKRRGHPLEDMVREQFSFQGAYLAVVTAGVLAPMLEELIFRGFLLSWLSRRQNGWQTGTFPGPNDSATQGAPGCPRFSRSAIVVTSLVFAAVHAPQWPAPIAIFVLALALGTVYARTGSLIASVIMHSAFNGVSTAVLFLALLVAPEQRGDSAPVKHVALSPQVISRLAVKSSRRLHRLAVTDGACGKTEIASVFF